MKTNRNQYKPQIAIHPGETLSEKLEELEISPIEFAQRTKIPVQTILDFIGGKNQITAEMAVKFECELNIPMRIWMKMQQNFTDYTAQNKGMVFLED